MHCHCKLLIMLRAIFFCLDMAIYRILFLFLCKIPNDSWDDNKYNDITGNPTPEIHISSRNLASCLALNFSNSDTSRTVNIQLTTSKQRTFHVSLTGIGLHCSPAGGIAMSTISNNGDSIWCKSLVGSHEDGLVTCHYECKCPDVCSNVKAYISNTITVSLCKIGGWNMSNSVLMIILQVHVSHFFF